MTDLNIANYFFGFVIAKVWGVEGLQRFVGKEIVQAYSPRLPNFPRVQLIKYNEISGLPYIYQDFKTFRFRWY